MKTGFEKSGMAVVAAVGLAFFAGCSGADTEKQDKSAERLAALEKDVSMLIGEVRALRHQIEKDAKMHSRPAMQRLPLRQNRLTPHVRDSEGMRNSENLQSGELPMRSQATRKDPANMTPEERRAWHEERRRMREERRRSKISESGKQTNPETQKEGENK